jgi:predicted ATPase
VRLLERDAELAELGTYWAEARAGHGRLVFPGGEAGAGKTSVGRELARRVDGRTRFLVGACDAGMTPQALGPLSDVAGALGVQNELDDQDVRHGSLFPHVRTALGRSPTHYLRYWVDEDHGKIFCLVDAPDAEAAVTVHKQAHGLVADEIYPVREGV